MFKFFASRKDETVGTRVLVCSFSDRFAAEIRTDGDVYKHCYRSVQTQSFGDWRSLKDAIPRIDLLHLLASVDPAGNIATAAGEHLSAATLLDECIAANVKAVIIASDNDVGAYIRGVPAKALNLVMTIRRRGEAFPIFLERLCALLADGVSFPLAWVKIAPQAPGPLRDSLPECIFAAGRPRAILLP